MFEGGKRRADELRSFGVRGTKLYLILLLLVLPTMAFFGWIEIKPVELNQIGDFLAGAFGPLAIFWLVLGFFQQGEELNNSVATLRLQADELAKSVEQQRELVSVTREQLAHEREMIKRQEAARKRRIQPKFIVEFKPSVINGNSRAKYGVNLSNVGNPASSFLMRLLDHSGIAASYEKKYFDRAFSVECSAFQGDYVPAVERELVIQIDYLDEDGDPWKASYTALPPAGENKFANANVRKDEVVPVDGFG